MEDYYLIQKAKKGDRNALDCLIRKYYQKIYNYVLYHVYVREAAEDLTQDIFLKLVRAIPNYTMLCKFTTFLYRIAHNTIVDFVRKKEEYLLEVEQARQPEEIYQVEDKVFIDSLLEKLPEEQRVCIVLCYIHGLKYREVAEVLEIPEATVKTRVRRGLALCRKNINSGRIV